MPGLKEQILERFELVLGFEIHIELSTPKKMFCECSASWFNKPPNTQICPVCLGMPGALPVPNKQALNYTIKIAKALNCKINHFQQFDRKHYFYPDLPKGYQITQFYHPVGVKGHVEIPTQNGYKTIRIHRIHLEEDTGKLVHHKDKTLIDFNRSGVPLVEIVTEPDFSDPYEAKTFLKLLRALVRLLGVSDADMEKGSMRLEPNISLRPKGSKELPSYKVEVKNINSFNFVVKAIEYEINRQGKLLLQGKTPAQETRGFDISTGKTLPQRRKEVAQDYRYLPEPDIPPIEFTEKELAKITVDKEQNPFIMYKELQSKKIDSDAIWFLIENQTAYKIFQRFVEATQKGDLAIIKKLKKEGLLPDERKFAIFLMNTFYKKSYKSLEDALNEYYNRYRKDTIDQETIEKIVKEVIKENPQAVADYKNGKENALQFLVGQFMRKLKRKIDVKPVIEQFRKELS